jgi:hypothetical protein
MINFKITNSDITLNSANPRVSVIPGFDSLSLDYYRNGSVVVNDWDSAAEGVGIPSQYIHKGQSKYNTDRTLLDMLNSEFVNQQGMVGEYYVTTYDTEHDNLYGEDNDRKYVRVFDFMFFTEEMFEPDFSNNMWGIWADNTNQIDVAKVGFLEASKFGSGNTEEDKLEEGYTRRDDLIFNEYQPHIGDYIRVKNVNLYYEINNVKNRYTSLQGTSFWQLTLLPMKDNQDTSVSDENGMENELQNIATNSTKEEDHDLFNMNNYPKEEGQEANVSNKDDEINPEFNDATGQDGWY